MTYSDYSITMYSKTVGAPFNLWCKYKRIYIKIVYFMSFTDTIQDMKKYIQAA